MASASLERVTFDPYFHWLELTTPDRPPNPYEMLGVPNFEESYARIQAAIQRKRALLDKFQEGAEPEVWNAVKERLESAIQCLTDPHARAILDAELRRAPLAARIPTAGAALERGAEPPELAPGACVECGAANPVDRRFCGNCGKSLWDQCPKCSTPHPRSERFCGQCGVNLRQYVDERRGWCETRLESARLAQEEYKFVEAAALLREVAKVDDPRLDSFAREAKSRLDSYQAQRKQLEEEARKRIEEAKKLLASYAVERALVTLDETPEPLKTEEHHRLYKDVCARRNRILELTADIRDAIARKDMFELAPLLEQMLGLKPDHKEAQQLAVQLAKKLADAARKRLEKHEYVGALDLLRRIPSQARGAEAADLESRAREGKWSFDQIRRSTLASTPQFELVKKTVALTPQDVEAQKQLRQWQNWLRTSPREPWLAVPDAHPLPKKPVAGCPVDWIGRSLRCAAATPEVERKLREKPGSWFVALGLAIQGIGQASVDVNLKPQEKGSVWSRLSLGRRRASGAAWGVDLGPTSLKAVLLKWDEKAGTATIEAAEHIEHATPYDAVKDEAQAAERLSQSIERFLAANPLAGHKLCTNISGLNTLSRWFLLPPIADKKLDDAVQFEARRQIAVPLEDLAWDYAGLEKPAEKKGEIPPRRISFVAVKQHVAQARLGLWSRFETKPEVLQSDAVALHNWLRFELAGEAAKGFESDAAGAVTGLLDIGGDVTNLVVSGPNTLWFRAVGQAGDDFTRAIAKEFQLNRSEAEGWKREPQKAVSWTRLASSLDPLFHQLLGEWQRSCSQFASIVPDESPRRLLCLGGGAALWGLVDALRIGNHNPTDDE
ncbi:MAG: pilus assembly protein PilM [Pirellulales bacterium]